MRCPALLLLCLAAASAMSTSAAVRADERRPPTPPTPTPAPTPTPPTPTPTPTTPTPTPPTATQQQPAATPPTQPTAPPASTAAGGAARWVCVPPRRGPFDECAKGSALDDGERAACEARQARLKPRPARLRLDRGPAIELSPVAWRCVALPTDHRPMIAIENHGRTYASWRLERGAGCASGVLDVVGPNFYGAMYTRCSRRDHTRDERLPAP